LQPEFVDAVLDDNQMMVQVEMIDAWLSYGETYWSITLMAA